MLDPREFLVNRSLWVDPRRWRLLSWLVLGRRHPWLWCNFPQLFFQSDEKNGRDVELGKFCSFSTTVCPCIKQGTRSLVDGEEAESLRSFDTCGRWWHRWQQIDDAVFVPPRRKVGEFNLRWRQFTDAGKCELPGLGRFTQHMLYSVNALRDQIWSRSPL